MLEAKTVGSGQTRNTTAKITSQHGLIYHKPVSYTHLDVYKRQGLEPVPFHKGFYSVDMTFFFEVTLDVFQTPAAPPVTDRKSVV